MYKNTPEEVGSDFVKLKTSIVKKTNVPTKVTILFRNPEFIPTIRFVAAAIRVMLVIIRNVAPPFADTNSITQGRRPSSRIEVSGSILPPLIAKFTALNIPPITKKNKNILVIDLRRGLLISDGFTALSVIRIPYRNPTAIAGINMMFIKIGDSFVIDSIWG